MNTSRLPGLSIFFISVLGLYLELLFIRWIGTEARIFAYLQNTVLVVCFFGLGIGCLHARREFSLTRLLVFFTILVSLCSIPLSRNLLTKISVKLSVLEDFLIWAPAVSSSPLQTVGSLIDGLFLVSILMILLFELFVPIGRYLGRAMHEHPHTITAYSINIAGSLIGTWLLVVLSAFSTTPFVWTLSAAVLCLFFVFQSKTNRFINLLLIFFACSVSYLTSANSSEFEVHWSPYQKLVLEKTDGKEDLGEYAITVNNTDYQELIDLSVERTEADPEQFSKEQFGLSQYDLPLLFHDRPQHVLIVGAGSGNDAAGALRNGGQKITAVDIDPAIIEIGKRYHPERPYDSPLVTVVNDDARSFFATTKDKYDVIIFGLLDSHTMTTMTNARLDHYVYTKESLKRVKALLRPNGIVVLSFYATRPYIADRISRTLTKVFGEKPLAFRVPRSAYGRGCVMFVSGDLNYVTSVLDREEELSAKLHTWALTDSLSVPHTTRITTDDWPYFYLRRTEIPILYYLLMALMIGLVWYCHLRYGLKDVIHGWNRSDWHFFFLGAAFLLLEVQNISKASVVLGNTWIVNVVIISCILLMILGANYITARYPKIHAFPIFNILLAVCVALYFIDLSVFAPLPYFLKALIVGLLTTLPVIFSGIVFIREFQDAEQKDAALGANLLGALVGALLQSITFITGIRTLLLIVAILYFAAVLTMPHEKRTA